MAIAGAGGRELDRGTVKPKQASPGLDAIKARLCPELNEPYFEVQERVMAIVTNRCTHENHGVRLDKTDRTATCKGCGKVVDPFDALLHYAASEKRLVGTLAQIKDAEKRDAERKVREKARRPFLRQVTGRVAVKDLSLKAEPTVGYTNTLECGHVLETPGDTHWRHRTCHACQAAANVKPVVKTLHAR